MLLMRSTSTSERHRHGPVLLAADEVEAAGESARLLHAAIESGIAGPAVRLLMDDPVEQQIVLPRGAARLLADMLVELANGNAVSLVSLQAELTTQQAADLLGVSRPYLVALLEEGKITHRRVGNRRRVPVADLLRYKDFQDVRTRTAVEALTQQAEELGLYDD